MMKDRQPCIAINRPRGLNIADAERLICNLASSIAWVERGGLIIDGVWRASRCMPMVGVPPPAVVLTQTLDLSYLPEPTDNRARLALALMRDGRGLNQAAYAFLSFYRVIEVAFPKGKQRGQWTVRGVGRLTEARAAAARAKLRMNDAQVGLRLYRDWRMALAHAQNDQTIDPDDPQQLEHLRSDLPIMEALAEMAVETELGVETKLAHRRRTRPRLVLKPGRP